MNEEEEERPAKQVRESDADPAVVPAVAPTATEAAIAKLEKKLEEAEANLKKWSANVEDPSYANAALAVGQQAFYQAQAKDAQAALLEEKKLLDKEKDRQLQLQLQLAAQTDGRIPIPDFSPAPSFPAGDSVEFVESDEPKKIFDSLYRLALTAPTSDIRSTAYTVVSGTMGSGKSTTVWRAIEKVSEELPDKKYIPCYLRLNHLEGLFPEFEKEKSDLNVLATILLGCFTGRKLVAHGALSLQQVGERAIKQYGSKYFLLHIDEFQSSPEVTKQLLRACCDTIWDKGCIIHVVPIVSGIPGLDFPVEVSNWATIRTQLGPLPLDGLWSSFSKAIGLPASRFGEHKNLSILFNDCGGYASQVVLLAGKIKYSYPQLAKDFSV